jgi:hypothetical protein
MTDEEIVAKARGSLHKIVDFADLDFLEVPVYDKDEHGRVHVVTFRLSDREPRQWNALTVNRHT